MTHPYLFCTSCNKEIPIHFARVGSSKRFAVNQKSILASKCAGGTHRSLQMMHAMQDLPPPVSMAVYSTHATGVSEMSILQARESMKRVRQEVQEFYDIDVEDGTIADIPISCDGTGRSVDILHCIVLYL